MGTQSATSVDRLHARMVDRLAEHGWIKTRNVENAFRALARHEFLPGHPLEKVYGGEAIIILVYGGDRAWPRFREWLAHPRPLDLRALQIDAVHAGSSPAQSGYLLRRREFDFLIHAAS